jgi:hypothetical protein
LAASASTALRLAVPENCWKALKIRIGGDGGIRTLDRALQPYNGLANRRLQPLGHVSGMADMPDAAASRKRQIVRSHAHKAVVNTVVMGWPA